MPADDVPARHRVGGLVRGVVDELLVVRAVERVVDDVDVRQAGDDDTEAHKGERPRWRRAVGVDRLEAEREAARHLGVLADQTVVRPPACGPARVRRRVARVQDSLDGPDVERGPEIHAVRQRHRFEVVIAVGGAVARGPQDVADIQRPVARPHRNGRGSRIPEGRAPAHPRRSARRGSPSPPHCAPPHSRPRSAAPRPRWRGPHPTPRRERVAHR